MGQKNKLSKVSSLRIVLKKELTAIKLRKNQAKGNFFLFSFFAHKKWWLSNYFNIYYLLVTILKNQKTACCTQHIETKILILDIDKRKFLRCSKLNCTSWRGNKLKISCSLIYELLSQMTFILIILNVPIFSAGQMTTHRELYDIFQRIIDK